MQPHLPAHAQEIGLTNATCTQCMSCLSEFSATEDSEVVEFEVEAYRRVIRRHWCRPSFGQLHGVLPPKTQPPGQGQRAAVSPKSQVAHHGWHWVPPEARCTATLLSPQSSLSGWSAF